MNGQYQKTPDTGGTIPEERKQQLLVLLVQMIQQSLTAEGTNKGSTTRTSLDRQMRMRQAQLALKRCACVEVRA